MFDKMIVPQWLIHFFELISSTLSHAFGLRIRVLSVVIFCGSLLLTVKLHHLWHVLKTTETFLNVSQSYASKPEEVKDASADKVKTESPPAKKDEHKAETAAGQTQGDEKPATSFADINPEKLTPEQYQALTQLSENKPNVDKASPDKESTLKAIETKIDEKIKKLEDTKSNLETLVKSVEEKDKANMERLVKIAESMKPEEASKILETLDLPVLMDLMEAIKPAKGAAILSVMDAAKAGYLMNEMAKRKKVVKTQEVGDESPQSGA
jgi:flagellar motility protein MotE (MotC chaperone)